MGEAFYLNDDDGYIYEEGEPDNPMDDRELIEIANRLTRELAEAREVAEAVCKAFDEGVFVRSTQGDASSNWAIKLLPHLKALGQLKGIADAREGEGSTSD